MVALLREFPDVRDVQSGAVAARPARGVCRGPGPGSVSRLGLKPADGLDRRRRRLHPRELLPRAAAANDRRLSRGTPSCWRGGAACRPPAERRGGRGASPPTTCATCRSGRSWPGSIPSISTATSAFRRLMRRGGDFTEEDKVVLREVELELLNASFPRTGTRRPAARSRSPRRRSTTQSCRCCATPTCICARTRDSRDAARSASCIPRMPRSSWRGRRPATSGCSAAGRSGLWPSEGSVSDAMVPLVAAGGVRVDGDRRADPGAHAGR